MGLVKKITPKTAKAIEFCKKYGDTFVTEWFGVDFIKVRSVETQDVLTCCVDGSKSYIDGELVDWN